MLLHPDRIIRKAIRSRYVVTTISDETFTGVLVDADDRTIVLADVAQARPDGSRIGVAGELILARDTVKYLQTATA